jgi:2-dehydropantoate 2-reductase
LSRLVRREGTEVLRVAGIDVASMEEDRERRGERLTPRLARGGGSTWQSLRRGTGALETDYLNGEIALLARLHGVDSPVNALLQRTANDAARNRLPPGSVRASDLIKGVAS